MEKQNKLKFNFVDVIVLLVLLAGIVFVALRFIGSGSGANPDPATSPEPTPSVSPDPDDPEETEAEYIITFYASEVADYIVDHLWVDSPLTDDSITLDLGTLVDYEIGPAQIRSTAADGHIVISELEGYSSVYVMARTLGTDNSFGITVDGLRLEIGHSIVLRTREAKLWVYVYDIQKIEDTPYMGSFVPGADNTPNADDDSDSAQS